MRQSQQIKALEGKAQPPTVLDRMFRGSSESKFE